MAFARITCTIIKAGRNSEYGQPLTVGSSYTGDADFVVSLVAAGFASLADPTVLYAGSPAKVVSATDIAQPTPAMLGNVQAVYRQGNSPFTNYSSNGLALTATSSSGTAAATPAVIPRALILSDGDSKAPEPLQGFVWWLANNPKKVEFGANYGVGGTGSDSTNGILKPSRLATVTAAIAAGVAAGQPVDMFLTIGINDVITPEATITNVKTYADAIKAAGVRWLFIMSVDPQTGSTAAKLAINAGYADLAASRTFIRFIDNSPQWLDFSAATTFDPIGASGGAYGAVTYDGTHASGYGNFLKGTSVGAAIGSLYPDEVVFPVSKADVFNNSTAPRANMLGANGRFLALGGTQSATGGTVTGTPPLGWTFQGALSGLVVTFTTTTSTALQTRLGLSAAPACVRMTFSGTAGADVSMQLITSASVVISSPGTGRMMSGILAYANAMTNFQNFQTKVVFFTPTFQTDLGNAGGLVASGNIPTLTQMLAIQQVGTETGNPNAIFPVLTIRVQNGQTISGSLDLIGFSVRKAGLVA
jgi:lysophospholipase L1-like esterase